MWLLRIFFPLFFCFFAISLFADDEIDAYDTVYMNRVPSHKILDSKGKLIRGVFAKGDKHIDGSGLLGLLFGKDLSESGVERAGSFQGTDLNRTNYSLSFVHNLTQTARCDFADRLKDSLGYGAAVIEIENKIEIPLSDFESLLKMPKRQTDYSGSRLKKFLDRLLATEEHPELFQKQDVSILYLRDQWWKGEMKDRDVLYYIFDLGQLSEEDEKILANIAKGIKFLG